LGRRVRHQLDLQLQEEHLTGSHVAARRRELAAKVSLQVVALADGIEDHMAAPGSHCSDAALCSIVTARCSAPIAPAATQSAGHAARLCREGATRASLATTD